MLIEFDRGSMPDDRTDPHDLPSDNQTAIGAVTKGTPDVRRSRSSARSQSGGARQSGIGCLDVQGVDKSFEGRAVVKGANLYVERGEAVALLGPSGAGKTTIFYMITGLIPSDRGRIELESHDISRLPMYRRARLGIGYVPQEVSVFCGLDVEQNIRAVLDVVEPDCRRRERDLEVLLEELDIARLRKRPSNALSADERRRVEVARALAAPRPICCSMNLSPTSTRWRSIAFRPWCGISPGTASGCSSPIS